MNWNNVTLEMYQAVSKEILSDHNDFEKRVNIVALMYNLTPAQVEGLTLEDFAKKYKDVSFILSDQIPGKAENYIKANGKSYFINYQVQKCRFGQYVEQLHFSGDLIQNAHYFMASLAHPVKKVFGFKRIGKNDSAKHEEVSNDFLQAKFIDVYHTAVFFYRVYKGSIILMKDYLVEEMTAKGMERMEAVSLLQGFINVTDGFITPKWFPSLKISA